MLKFIIGLVYSNPTNHLIHPAMAGQANHMNVQKEGEKYYCEICGNEVTVTKAGGGELICCGKPMELLKEVTE